MNVNLSPKVVAMAAREWLVFLAQAQTAVQDGREVNTGQSKTVVPPGVSVIPVEGVLLPSVPDWMKFFGLRVTGYDDITTQLKEAVNNPTITEIVLAVDSPGGTVQGVVAASAAVREAAAKKKVTVWVEGMCASGAYWLCAPASRIIASTTAEVGSIGVYQVWYDETARLEKAGITTHVIRSGAMKGMGLDAITLEQIETEQQNVDDLAALFVQAVAAGRKMEEQAAQSIATGQTWTAERAKQLGLVNTVLETYEFGQLVSDETEANMAKKQNEIQPVAEVEVVETVETETVIEPVEEEAAPAIEETTEEATVLVSLAVERARCASIMKAFGKLDAEFACAQIEAGATELEAKAAWFDKQPASGGNHAGVAPILTAPVASDAPKPTVMERVKALQAQNPGMLQIAALKAVQSDDPETFARFQRGEAV